MIFAKNNVFFLKNIEKTCVFYDIFGGGFFATYEELEVKK